MENKTHHRVTGAPPSSTTTTTSTTTTAAPSTTPPPPEPPAPRRRATGVKRKANNSTTKRQTRVKTFTPLPHIHHNHNGPITRARQSPNKAVSAAGAATYSSSSPLGSFPGVLEKPYEPLPQSTQPGNAIGDVTNNTSQGPNVTAKGNQTSPVEMDIDAQFEAIRSRDPNVHVIPTPAAWFSWTKIHALEERALPSFFNGKSENRTPDTYMQIRNSIMKKFHMDPKTQIEAKDLSEMTVGELDTRKEVMEFLDHWGLINFHPFPVVNSEKAETNADGSAKLASLIDKLYKFEVPVTHPQDGLKADLSTQAIPPRLFPESKVADEVRQEGPAVEYHCNSCSADCSRKRYHCQKQADFDLCSECYNNSKFDSGMSPADFILMEPAEVPGVSGGSWTDQETLLLLEALELFGENWSEIAEHVATKSKAQCILHFVQMPIEDTFLEGKDDFNASLEGKNFPDSTQDDTSALKESNEVAENKNASSTDLSALKESHEPKKSDTTNDDSSTLNKSSETTESKSTVVKGPLSPKVDEVDKKGAVEVKINQELTASFAVNALKEAFELVGSGESTSFADVGNPVMALAAFLSCLVEPDVVAASARSSLKAILGEAPGVQLASRHCFILEDPLEDAKEPPASESADVEMLDGEAKKDDVELEAQKDDDKSQKDEYQKEKDLQVQKNVSMGAQKDKDQKDDIQVQNHMEVVEANDVSKDFTNEETEKTVPKEAVLLPSLQDEGKEDCLTKEPDETVPKEAVILPSLPGEGKEDCLTKEPDETVPSEAVLLPSVPDEGKEDCTTTKSNEVIDKEDVEPGNKNEVTDSALPGQDKLSSQDEDKEISAAKELDDVANEDAAPVTVKESDDSTLQVKDLPSSVNGSGALAVPSEMASVSVKETSPVALPGEISEFLEVPKDEDKGSSSVLKDNGPRETVTPSLAIDGGANAGGCDLKVVEAKSEKIFDLSETKDDHNIEKVKRAALTALSAAALKSKLLADQEEDEIRQLATFLIDKQLLKIETKLAFFADMDNAIMRGKDLVDKSRQRLYHERAQIITARLGMATSSSRAMPPSLPSNRVALNYANSVPKSLPNMNSQTAPVRTATNTSAPSPPYSSVSNAAPGFSTHTSR